MCRCVPVPDTLNITTTTQLFFKKPVVKYSTHTLKTKKSFVFVKNYVKIYILYTYRIHVFKNVSSLPYGYGVLQYVSIPAQWPLKNATDP